MSVAEILLQPVSRRAHGKVENLIQLASGASSGAREHHWHVKAVEDFERLLEDSAEETSAAEGFAKMTVRVGPGTSV